MSDTSNSVVDTSVFGGEDTSPPAIGHNQPPMDREEMLKEFNRNVNTLGAASGKGSAALPRLGLLVIRAANDGLISTEKPKGKDAKSDAVRIYDAYAAQDSRHAEHSAGGLKANAAKVNALIGLGCQTTCDGVAVADRTLQLHEAMVQQDLKPKAVFAGLVDVARAQAASDTELTDDAIVAALTKTPVDKTIEKEWAAIYKKVEGLVTGEGPAGKDDSDLAHKISDLVNERCKLYTPTSDLVKKLMERGYTLAMAESIAERR